uniref:Small ribosomal subunit protein mS29 n=1 Tax=Globodera rostochiensis TaxID=31243 RepID=A0A914HBD4_GLORO
MLFCRRILSKGRPVAVSVSYGSRATYLTTSTNEPAELGPEDVGKLYRVPESLFGTLNLPYFYNKQLETLRECVWLYRQQTHEVFNCLHEVDVAQRPALRLVLWGRFGTGKTITLNQLIQLAHSRGYIIFTVQDAMKWSRDNYRPIQMSTYKPGRVDSPWWAVRLLNNFKRQNSASWDKLAQLKTTKFYQWTKAETTPEGKPLTDIVEMGLTAPYLATDCLGALCRELRAHASAGSIKLLVAIDKANGLFGKCVVKRADRKIASSEELSLNISIRKFLMPIWSNGLCAMIADKAAISDARDHLSVCPTDPRSLFGDKGYEQIEPFVSVETKSYSESEFNVIHDYYLEKNWIRQKKGPDGEEAKRQIMYLSAFNPFFYERLCSFAWDMGCRVPS